MDSNDWDDALECAALLADASDNEHLAREIRALKGGERAKVIAVLRAFEAQEAAAVHRTIFTNVETGHMIDNGDGTFSLSDKGRAHVENLLRDGGAR